jgi:single-strand DNA-binding protein
VVGASFSHHAQGGGIWPDGAGMPDPQPQALHQPTRHLSRAHSATCPWPTSLAPPLAPGGLSACHGVHRPPAPGVGQTARPGNRKGHTLTEAAISFAGNLTDQPEVRYTEGGIARARFWVAVSGRRDQEASFFTVVVWRDQAEHAAESLSKGSRVVVVGRLQQRSWTAEDGSARSVVEVIAEELGASLRWATATTTRTTRSQEQASTA